jgi:hypothetical protein
MVTKKSVTSKKTELCPLHGIALGKRGTFGHNRAGPRNRICQIEVIDV